MGVRLLTAALGFFVTLTAVAWGADDKWVMIGATDVRYFNWNGNIGSGPFSQRSGDQLYLPYTIGIYGRPNENFAIDLVGRGGWVNARQTTPGLEGEVDTITDTQFAATVAYYGLKGIQPFVSLGMNLPTGEPALFGSSVNAIMNPNLVDIVTFGEGFNIAPTVGVTVPISKNLVLTVSAGKTWRGGYDQAALFASGIPLTLPDGSLTPIDPGDSSTVTGSIGYQKGRLQLTATGSISRDTTTTENLLTLNGVSGWEPNTDLPCCEWRAIMQQQQGKKNVPIYEPGDRYFVSGTLGYDWHEAGATTLNASVSLGQNNKVNSLTNEVNNIEKIVGPPDLQIRQTTSISTQTTRFTEEPFNSNGDFYQANVQHLFPVGQKLSIGPAGSFLRRTANDYAPGTLQYAPEATRWSAGAVLRYAFRKMTVTARLEHVWLNTGAIPAPGGSRVDLLSSSSCNTNWGDRIGEDVFSTAMTCVPWSGENAENNRTNIPAHPNSVAGTPVPSASFDDWQGTIGVSITF